MATQTATTRRRAKTKAYTSAVNATPGETPHNAGEPEIVTAAFLDPATRNEIIARAAYFRAERRGFAEGCALQDWLEAEAEIDARATAV